jgi:putative phosphoesterase
LKILVVSDVHSNLTALEAVLDDAGPFDAAISAGDIVGYGPHPQECADRLGFKGFRCALGNHDNAVATMETEWFNDYAQDVIRINREMLAPATIKWLGALPQELKFELDGHRFAVYHGSPTEPLTSYIYPMDAETHADRLLAHAKADIIILGHTHVPYQVKRNSKLILNPGSVGQPRDGDPRASYLTIETNPLKAQNHRVEYSIDATAEAIDAAGLPHILATRLYRGT